MLPDSLAKGLDGLDISEEERKALSALRLSPGMAALRKVLLSRVLAIEEFIFSPDSRRLSDPERRTLIEQRMAYYEIAQFITPSEEDEPDE